jgi:class 3 adenylate cyclase/DNA-binding CsgD family transcriptional regulator
MARCPVAGATGCTVSANFGKFGVIPLRKPQDVMHRDRQLAAIMFTDIVGFSARMQEGERGALELRNRHRRVFEESTGRYGGKILQYYGDGTLSIFNSTIKAVQCAVEMQEAFRQAPEVLVRVGIHSGDIFFVEGEAVGDGVNVAARVQAAAGPGTIFISGKVYDDIKNQEGLCAKYLGRYPLKNIDQPVDLYAVANPGLPVPGQPEGLGFPQETTLAANALPMHPQPAEPEFFTARERELAEVRSLLERLQQSRPGALLISGAAGVGKSALVHAALGDYPVLCIRTRVYEGGAAAFGPLTAALRFLLKNVLAGRQEELRLLHHLALILPELGPEGPSTDLTDLTAAIREVFQTAARHRPLVLLIEDLHWADAATIDLLPKLFDMEVELPFLFIGTYRSDHLGRDSRIRPLKAELRRITRYHEIGLMPFSEDDCRDFLRKLFGREAAPDLAAGIHARSMGIPLYMEEMARSLEHRGLLSEGPEGLTLNGGGEFPIPETAGDIVLLQLEGLGGQARELVQIAATLGLEFEFDLLSELTPDPGAIDEIIAQGLVLEKEDGKGAFRHAVIMEAIRRGIPWSKRRLLNRQVAGALQRRGADPALTGEYWLRAGEKAMAREALVQAARQYCDIHAHRDAARLAGKALELWPIGEEERQRVETLRQYAHCTRINGQADETLRALQQILESPVVRDNPAEKAENLRALSSCHAQQGQWHQYRQLRESAAKAYGEAGAWDEASRDWHELANRCMDDLKISEAVHAAREAVDCARRSDRTELLVKTLSTLGYVLSMQGRPEEGLSIARESLDLARSTGDMESTAYAYRKLAGVLEFASNFTGAIKAYDSALNFCHRQDLDLQAVFCLSCMSWVYFRLGDWARALEVCREVLGDADTNDASRCTAHCVSALVHAYRGELKTAGRHVRKAAQLGQATGFRLMLLINYWPGAVLPEFEGRTGEAFQHYMQMLEEWRNSEDRHEILGGIGAALSFFAGQGRMEEVSICIAHCVEIAEQTGNPEALGTLAFGLGVSAALAGRTEEADGHFGQAVRYFTQLELPLQLIYTRYHYGKALLPHDRAQGVDLLKNALQSCRNLGIRPLARLLEEALSGAGEVAGERRIAAHPERHARAGLTARQLEIVQAMAEGLSNKEIASRLHLSTRTVDMHVGNALNALNCRSRTEAVKIAVELGMV